MIRCIILANFDESSELTNSHLGTTVKVKLRLYSKNGRTPKKATLSGSL